jgi:RNA recognition motif-containing protein
LSATKVYIGNLPFDTPNDRILPLFAPFGAVSEFSAPRDSAGKLKGGFALLTMDDDEAALAAIDFLNDTEFEGRNVKTRVFTPKEPPVRFVDPRPFNGENLAEVKVFVGNLSYRMNEEAIKALFQSFGKIVSVVMPADPDGKIRGYAFVTMAAADAEAAITALDQSENMGRKILVSESRPLPFNLAGEKEVKLHVGNLDFGGIDEPALKALFESHGEIVNFHTPGDLEEGKVTKGFVIITMAADAAQAALSLNGSMFGGRDIRVSEAKKRQKVKSVRGKR